MRLNIYLRPSDLEGLPAELLEQLSCCNRPHHDQADILTAIGDADATVDQIIVGVYRANKKVLKRNAVIGHLFRMQKSGAIVKAGRGLYRRASTVITPGSRI